MKVFCIEEFWDTKGLVKSRKSEKDRPNDSLNKKDKMTKNYKTLHTKHRGELRALKSKQFLLH